MSTAAQNQMENLSANSTVVAAPDQVSCDLNGEAVVLNLTSGVYYGLDPMGAVIWKLVQQPKSVKEIRDSIVDEYDVESQRCESDLMAFLGEMKKNGLLRVAAAPR